MMNWRLSSSSLIISLLAACALPMAASDMPVFRYALLHWEPDAYDLAVFHAGAMSPDVAAAIQTLQAATGRAPANLNVTIVDVGVEAAGSPIPDGTPPVKIPGAVLGYPPRTQPGQAAWEGAVNADIFGRLVDSPARRELAKRLADGGKPAWIMIESGNAAADASAARELAKLQLDAVRVRRNDPAEQIFISILEHSEEELFKYAAQPLVFPVFGRGRMLSALAGKGINQDTLSTAFKFLTGPCACENKAENPGTDLLLAADWQAALLKLPRFEKEERSLATISSEESPDQAPAQAVQSTTNAATAQRAAVPATPTGAEAEPSGIFNIAMIVLILIGLVVVAVSALVFMSRRR